MVSAGQRRERIRSAVDLYQGRLIAFSLRITGDLETARDVVQDAFLRLCEQDLDALADLPAWLFRVCRNRALDVMRKEGPVQPLDAVPEPTAVGPASDPERSAEEGLGARRVLAAIAALPAAQQEVLRLRFREELSYKEISAITHHSVSNVGVLIHTGIRQLRARLRAASGPAPERIEGERTDA